jgi:hypothetical protein
MICLDRPSEGFDVVRDLAQMGYQVVQVFQGLHPPFVGRECVVDVENGSRRRA